MGKIARHTPTLSGERKIRALSIDSALFPDIGDAVTSLASDDEWEEVGDTVAAVVAECKEAVENWYSDMLIGMVSSFVASAPAGWLELDGSTYAGADYPELSTVLPASWVSGANFTLPDMQDIFLAGVGSAGTAGASGGANTHVLTLAEMPAHTHGYTFPVASPDTVGAGAPIPSVMSTVPATATSSAGSDNAHENRPAFVALVFAVFAGRE